MRLIVACTACTRQFDARGRDIGSHFHCHCGELLTVAQPSGHDASVVRCSSCGGARSKGDVSCRYCTASFTLHERDLHTICPSCLARISDAAAFCHHCATPITAETSASALTQKHCPVCHPGLSAQGEGAMLSHRLLGDHALPILECARCGGMWIGRSSFRALEQEAASMGRTVAARMGPDPTPVSADDMSQAHTAQGPIYRKCPECQVIMNRQNYGRISGIIIDVCKDHGAWFDNQELDAILRWVKAGGLEKSAAREALKLGEERRRIAQSQRDASAMMAKSGSIAAFGTPRAEVELGNAIFEFAWRSLKSLFH